MTHGPPLLREADAVVPALRPPRRRPADVTGPRRPASGRATLRTLAWGPGQGLVLTLTAGSVLAVPGPDPSVRVGDDGYLRLPIGVRRACRLTAGDRVLLVAEPGAGRLLLHPPAALTVLLAAHQAAIAEGATP